MTDSFQFVGQAHGGMVPAKDALLVLDTNVVSALHSVAKRGFDLGKASDRRVAHLLHWGCRHGAQRGARQGRRRSGGAGHRLSGSSGQDNARAHRRGVDASWEAIGAALPEGWEELVTFAVVVKMVKAAIALDWPMFNAWTEKLAADRTDGIAMLCLWTLGRAVLENTAAARAESLDALLDRMIRRIEDR